MSVKPAPGYDDDVDVDDDVDDDVVDAAEPKRQPRFPLRLNRNFMNYPLARSARVAARCVPAGSS